MNGHKPLKQRRDEHHIVFMYRLSKDSEYIVICHNSADLMITSVIFSFEMPERRRRSSAGD